MYICVVLRRQWQPNPTLFVSSRKFLSLRLVISAENLLAIQLQAFYSRRKFESRLFTFCLVCFPMHLPCSQENKPIDKKNQHFRPANFIIAVKPQTKKAKTEAASEKQPLEPSNGAQVDEKPPDAAESALGGLVSYSDESEDDN